MRLKAALGSEAGVHKEAFLVIPFLKSAVVEQFQVVLDNEGHKELEEHISKTLIF